MRLVHFGDVDDVNWRELEVAVLAQLRNEWELYKIVAKLVGGAMRSMKIVVPILSRNFRPKSTQDVPWDRGVPTSVQGEGEHFANVAQVGVAIAAVVDLNTKCWGHNSACSIENRA